MLLLLLLLLLIRQLSKGSFKKHFHDLLLSIMETEDDYVEALILLQKIAKSAATT